MTGNQAHSFDELSPSEPAWKLQLRIRRSDDAEFEETEIFRTNLIDLPKDLSAVRLNSTGMADGIPFSVPFVSSAGKVQDDGDKLSVETTMQTELSTGSIFRGGNGGQVWFVESSRPLFQLQIQSTLEAEVNLLIAVKDQDGRRLSDKHPNSATYYQGNIPVKYIEFDPAPETKSVQLEVKVNRARTFEFFVSPRKDSTGANQ
ncbi:MAG: hypothetical protein FJ267_05365 [Planctomycetes bacterium]|nr:hypothetical protein [Planctomycetota bacterium]